MRKHRIKSVILPLVLIATALIVMGADVYYNPVQVQSPRQQISPFEAFLDVNGIPGECADAKHKDWIEILSFSFGVEQLADGNASFHDLVIEKTLDNASPKLAEAACKGTHIADMNLEICRSDGKTYMKYDFNDVMVTGVLPKGSVTRNDELPQEKITFTYGIINCTHIDENNASISAAWDVNGQSIEWQY
jgi:type VI secretion system secreted protein Hcp